MRQYIVPTTYIVFLTLFFISCQNQQKVDVDNAKKASIDSMQLEITKIKEQKVSPQNVTVVNQPADTTATAKKKGWSGTAKGAVIGAGVGAATGAIVNKKKGTGAIIGRISRRWSGSRCWSYY